MHIGMERSCLYRRAAIAKLRIVLVRDRNRCEGGH